jgi:hypothetical protein
MANAQQQDDQFDYDPNWGTADNQPNRSNQNQPPQATDYSGYVPPQTQGPFTQERWTPAQPPSAPPAQPFDRSNFRDDINGAANAYDVLNKYGLTADKAGRVTLPTGEIMDVIQGAGAGGTKGQWMGVGETHNGQTTYYPPAGSGGAGGGGAAVPSAAAQDPMVGELLARLKARADQSLNINAATDPNIRQQADPYAANLERQRRNYLNAQAERLGPNADLTNERRLTAEQTGQQAGQYESGLVGNEVAARREEIQNALTQMGGLLTDQQRMALQKELADMNDATQRYSIGTQAATANRQIDNDWQKALLGNDLNWAHLGLDAENDYNNWNHVFTS